MQDGFGWTNGVAIALQKILTDGNTVKEIKEVEQTEEVVMQ